MEKITKLIKRLRKKHPIKTGMLIYEVQTNWGYQLACDEIEGYIKEVRSNV